MADKPENKFVLKPIVEEWDGKYVPISELRYSPRDLASPENCFSDIAGNVPCVADADDEIFHQQYDLGGEG